ncbi:MAG: glycosyltransferase family 2 protein [Paraglaciecola sp.]|nr:glycosyltransferase family 2 protein [Paraglaciecola sp.]
MTKSLLTPAFQFNVKSKPWLIEAQHKFDLKVKSSKSFPAGWYRISVKAKNKAAQDFIANGGNFWLHQNHNTLGASLIKETKDKLALVFLRHNPLRALTLHWHKISQTSEAPEFIIKITELSVAKAWFFMLSQVSRKHSAEGGSRSYIFRISRARSKRAGVKVALTKLVKEYNPQLSYQLISCEPYSFWRQNKEPQLMQEKANNLVHINKKFHLVIRAKENLEALKQTLSSLQTQSYPLWQVSLCELAALSKNEVEQLLSLDNRFQLQENTLIDPSDYLIFMQEGDLLNTNSLSIIASELEVSQVKLIYSDHDLLNEDGLRVAPRFKPQWSPDFLMHHNYIGFAFTVQAALLQEEITHPKWYLEHHYLLLLAAIKNMAPDLRAKQIQHLPLVLFHQAQANFKRGYTQSMVTKLHSQFHELAKQNNEHLIKVTKGKADNLFHLHYAIPKPWPLVSLIIPTRDALNLTRTCVNSILFLTQYPHYEIIIVDNQSSDPETLKWLDSIAQHEKVKVLSYDKPFNYSAINNFAVKQAKGSVIGLINNDTEVISKNWLTEMLQHACRPDIGCVGAKLYYFDDTIQHGGVVLGLWGLAGHAHKNYLKFDKGHQSRLHTIHNVSAVTAACLLVRKEIYEAVGGLEEYHLTVAFNDVDFCLKVQQAGYRNIFTPYAELYHYESKSRGKEDTPEKKAREQGEIAYMQLKWTDIIADDPYYNRNLTRLREDFSINIDDSI